MEYDKTQLRLQAISFAIAFHNEIEDGGEDVLKTAELFYGFISQDIEEDGVPNLTSVVDFDNYN